MRLVFQPALLAALLSWQALSPGAARDGFHYERSIALPPTAAEAEACATLDAAVFAHAAPSLKDLRLFSAAGSELPYATTLSEPVQQETDDAAVVNVVSPSPNRLVFDLKMPARLYTSVVLNLNRQDFLATAAVTGEMAPTAHATGHPMALGTFTLFDLSSRHLARATTLPLSESSFPYLHVALTFTAVPGSPAVPAAPAMLRAATVPPSREAQTIYIPTQQTAALTRRGNQTLAGFMLPVHVPVERIRFELPPGFHGSFRRTVRITAQAQRASGPSAASEPQDIPQLESFTGTLSRTHLTIAGHQLSAEELSIPASIGSNMQQPAALQVAIDNGSDAPLPLSSIVLEMKQRRLCFKLQSDQQAGPLTLAYGDPTLPAPRYPAAGSAGRTRSLGNPASAQLGPEQLNPAWRAPAPVSAREDRARPTPTLLWIAVLTILCLLATAAFHTLRRRSR